MSTLETAKPPLPPRSPAWRMPHLVRLSLLCHLAVLSGFFVWPERWPLLVGALILNHGVLTLTGLWPRSNWLGTNWTVLPQSCVARKQIALTIDDGPDPAVTPQVLDLLDSRHVKATFFCIGQQAARYPALCREIVARGHAIENHSQHHPHMFSLFGRRGMLREVESAQQTLLALTGRQPQFFRAPAGLRNLFLDPVLHQAGLQLASWTRRGFDTRTQEPALVTRRLLRHLKAGDILLLHDRNSALTTEGIPVILLVLPILIDAANEAGLTFITLPEALQQTP